MGILCIILGVICAFLSFITFATATGLPQQIFAGELGIAFAVFFGAGCIINAIDKLRIGVAPQTEPKKADISQVVG